jgi:hypothetical protein
MVIVHRRRILALYLPASLIKREQEEETHRGLTTHSGPSRENKLKDEIEIVRPPTFFEHLVEHLDTLLLTIEASIMYQGGSVTMADEMHCFGRLFQALASAVQVAVLAKLEKRFARLEKPRFILALIFHSMYAKLGRAIVDGGDVDVLTLTT